MRRKETEMEEERKREEEEKRRQQMEKDKKDEEARGLDVDTVKKVLSWIQEQKDNKDEEQVRKVKIQELQEQIQQMTQQDNRQACPMTGVNLLMSLELIQGDGAAEVDLTVKTQQQWFAGNNAKKRKDEAQESDGESVISNLSQNKNKRLTSGFGMKSGQNIKFEI